MDAIIERDNQWTYIDLDQARYDGESLILYFKGSFEHHYDSYNVYIFKQVLFNTAFMDCRTTVIAGDGDHNIEVEFKYRNQRDFYKKEEKFSYLFDLLDFFLKNEDKLDERTASPIWA